MDDPPCPTTCQWNPGAIIPLELVQEVNRAHFLHILSLDPDQVLPPGKSLISVVVQEKLGKPEKEDPDDDKKPTTVAFQERVALAMRAAFWDATAEKLSSPDPSEQNIHIKRLLNDLHEAVLPLLPPQYLLLKVLSLPPPPSVAPLYSFAAILKEVLIALHGRCASIRDSEIVSQLQKLEDLPPQSTLVTSTILEDEQPDEAAKGPLPIATLVTDSLKAILTIIDHMKSDLHDFVLGSMTEEQLRALVMREAKFRERDLVIKLWSPQYKDANQRGEDVIREKWRLWCRQTKMDGLVPEEHKWKSGLLQALAAPKAISCIPPQYAAQKHDTDLPANNDVPPQFFFSITSLYQLQDYLQAMVIAAALRSLTRLPPPTGLMSSSVEASSTQSFMQRVWVLLNAEVGIQVNHERSGDDSLKLINLEDEVVRARRLAGGTLDSTEEKKLRHAVGRTLRPNDPVFLLLQKRLIDALLKSIAMGSVSERGAGMPDLLKAGRGHPEAPAPGKRLKLMISDDELAGMQKIASPSIVSLMSPVKGFEDPVLSQALEGAFVKLAKIVGWTECVWGDLV